MSDDAVPTTAFGISVRRLGGPTVLLELGGLRLLTDPTFDPPGAHPIGSRVLTKTTGPAIDPRELGPIDAVLLSHDQHPDNLDDAGRTLLSTAPLVLSTVDARDRLGGAVRALPNWEQMELPRPDGRLLRVTGVPAQHGPDGSRHLVGDVTGFVLAGPDLPTVYISGDNASLRVVGEIAERFPRIDVAILHAGAARTPLLDGYLTLTSEEAAKAARILAADQVIAVHVDGWAHFTEGPEVLVPAFERAGLADRLHLPDFGQVLTL